MSRRYRIENGARFRLSSVDPDDTGKYAHHDDAQEKLEDDLKRLRRLHERLYAEHRRSLLVVLQAIDTGGKDGTIKHVFSGLNPQGVHVTSFKAPSEVERDHPYLWRIQKALPARGEIAIWNRSHYEDVLVVRVHDLVPQRVWSKRYAQINDFERYLAENDVLVVKFFLLISKQEQKERMLDRLNDPEKQWKFDANDLRERACWNSYQRAYQAMIQRCSKPWAPWYVIPANKKWYRNLLVADALVDTLSSLHIRLPRLTYDPKKIKIA